MKKHGHYCRICGQYKANEKFSGRGHAAHVCKACVKRGNKPPTIKPDTLVFVDDDSVDVFPADIDIIPFSFEEEPSKPKRKRKPDKAKQLRAAQKKQAKALLSTMLINGDVSVGSIMKAAGEAGISTEALRRAKGSLGIRSIVTETGSVWRLAQRNMQTEHNPK